MVSDVFKNIQKLSYVPASVNDNDKLYFKSYVEDVAVGSKALDGVNERLLDVLLFSGFYGVRH